MRPRLGFSLLLPVLFLALASTAFAHTWYVDGIHGIDSNNCETATTACKTIGHAINLARSRDVIYVAAATYTENLIIPFSLDIIGTKAKTTIIDGGGVAVTVSAPYNPGAYIILSNLTIQNGYGGSPADGDGGGISSDTDMMIIYSIVTGNNAGPYSSSGGGVYNGPNATMTIDKTTISGNTAYYGGGVACGGGGQNSLLIYNSTITDNIGMGASAILGSSCNLRLINDTISGNIDNGSNPEGAAIAVFSGTLGIDNSTISGNSNVAGAAAAGIWTPSGPGPAILTMQNSIIANNTPQNCSGVIASDGYNLSSDDTCNLTSTGDMSNTNPVLGALLNNGGATKTMAIKPGSPAIDAGNPAGCTDGHGHLLGADQRGDHRPGDPKLTTGCDIGAYEYQFPK
jgi:hypothetical protein